MKNLSLLILAAGTVALLTIAPAGAAQRTPRDVRPWIPLDSLLRPDAQPDSTARADVVIRASAQAREIRFEVQPRASVRVWACPGTDTVRVERRNLPKPVEPGVVYRDAYARIDLHAALAADTALARMLGTKPDSVMHCPAALPTRRAGAP